MNIADKINGLSDFWEMLENIDKPIVLYGMGNGADKIINELNRRNIKISGIFASDDFVRYQQFHGFTVKRYNELLSEFGDMIVLVCFGTQRDDVLQNIKKIMKTARVYAPDVAVVGGGLFTKQYALDNIDEIEKIYDLLYDDISKSTFINIISYKITGDIRCLFECENKTAPFELSDDESFMDLGAYKGDTVAEFIEKVGGKYDKIYAVEPDRKNYNKLLQNISNYDNISALNVAISRGHGEKPFAMNAGRNSTISDGNKSVIVKTESVDSILNGNRVSYIKMDVEGEEKNAILGAEKTIAKYRPKMKIAAYHRFNDILQIPKTVMSLNPDYRLNLRHCPYVPAWDTDYYFE